MRRVSPGRLLMRWLAITLVVAVVGLPVAAVAAAAVRDPAAAWQALRAPAALAALWLTLWTAAVVTVVNAVAGTAIAWVLARYRFRGHGLLATLVDLPLAVPTVVTGLMLVALYGPQELAGGWLAGHGVRLLFDRPGIVLALLTVTFPFVVRAVEPVLAQLQSAEEEAAFTLGAWPWQSFLRVTLPAVIPAILTSSLLTFARALGEFGAVVVVAGNLPRETLTAPVYVFGTIESGRADAASAMSLLLIALSFALVFVTDRYTRRRLRSMGAGA